MTLGKRVALVTGAARGIGREVALTLGHRGYAVAANDLTPPEETLEELRNINATALPVPGDVSDERTVRVMVEAVMGEFGRVNVLVNNAGVSLITPAEETDLSCVNPLEIPPMGDCDLAEVKREFGDRIALMGNLHTTEVMLKGSVEDVRRACEEAIDAAGEGGGFILSTGDQCGTDTPDENIRAMVDVAKTYGRY